MYEGDKVLPASTGGRPGRLLSTQRESSFTQGIDYLAQMAMVPKLKEPEFRLVLFFPKV